MNNYTSEMFPAFKNLIIFLHSGSFRESARMEDSIDFVDMGIAGIMLEN